MPIDFYKISVDAIKWIIDDQRVWPCPIIKYFKINNKIKENVFSYMDEIKADLIIDWILKTYVDDLNDK